MPRQRKQFTRKKTPRRLVPTENTNLVMASIHSYEGVMTHSQIVRLCFPGCTSSWPFERMQHYFDHKLVKKHDASNVNGRYLGEIIYTLERNGAFIAAQTKQKDWSGFRWRRNPRWLTLIHDLAINNFRLDVVKACEKHFAFTLESWISEYELSLITPRIPGRLDSFFVLRRGSMLQSGRIEQLAFHLEIDTGSHPINRVMKRKVKPILNYFVTDSYAKQFGVSDGVCLFVTSSESRLNNLKKAIEEGGGDGLFYLTTSDAVSSNTVLTQPIWQLAGSDYIFSIENMPLSPVVAGVLNNAPSMRSTYQESLFV